MSDTQVDGFVSIHAPNEGSDMVDVVTQFPTMRFNPRSQ